MPQVAIFKNLEPGLSEGFVTAHRDHMSGFSAQLMCGRRRGNQSAAYEIFPGSCVGDCLRRSSAVFPFLAPLASGFRKLPRFDLWHAHFGPDGVSALPLARAQGAPLVVTFHGFDATLSDLSLLLEFAPTKTSYVFRRRRLLDEAALILGVSNYISGRLIGLGAPAPKTRTLYVGVDTDRFQPAPVCKGSGIVLNVGRLVESKGQAHLLRAMPAVLHEFPQCRLQVVGDGPERTRLKRLAAELGISGSVDFLGALDQSSIVSLYQHADVFAFPTCRLRSGVEEALGLVLNEAAACGLPIVAMRAGGIAETVLPDESGILVEEADIAGFSHGICYYLRNPQEAVMAGLKGRTHCVSNFNVRKQAATLEGLYAEVLWGRK